MAGRRCGGISVFEMLEKVKGTWKTSVVAEIFLTRAG